MKVLLLPLLMVVGCAARHIPGTDIEDNSETRAIIQVLEQYRRALESKDSNAVLTLVADSFQDNAGTATPEDDLDFARLRETLPRELAKVDQVRLDLEVRAISVKSDLATAVISYRASFQVPSLGTKPQNTSELDQMTLRRVNGRWKITSGI